MMRLRGRSIPIGEMMGENSIVITEQAKSLLF